LSFQSFIPRPHFLILLNICLFDRSHTRQQRA
jgi:hypothetical protein